jgi:hypothetical protein
MYDVRWREIIYHSTLIEANSAQDAAVGISLLALTSTGSLGEDDELIDSAFLGVDEIISPLED